MNPFVPFPEPRVFAVFHGRRKRFLADMVLEDGTPTVAHCPNTGSMKGCLFPGHRALLWDSRNPKRKLRYTWKAIEADGFWVGIDTGVPNRLVEEAVRRGAVPGLRGFTEVLREKRMGARSRVDLLLRGPSGECWVEVKNVTLVRDGRAIFPDAPTARGRKHLRALRDRVAAGDRALLVFCVQRPDARSAGPADAIDPDYGRLLREVLSAGVEIAALSVRTDPRGLYPEGQLPVVL